MRVPPACCTLLNQTHAVKGGIPKLNVLCWMEEAPHAGKICPTHWLMVQTALADSFRLDILAILPLPGILSHLNKQKLLLLGWAPRRAISWHVAANLCPKLERFKAQLGSSSAGWRKPLSTFLDVKLYITIQHIPLCILTLHSAREREGLIPSFIYSYAHIMRHQPGQKASKWCI